MNDREEVERLARQVLRLTRGYEHLLNALRQSQMTLHELGKIRNPNIHLGNYEDCAEMLCVRGRMLVDMINESYLKEEV